MAASDIDGPRLSAADWAIAGALVLAGLLTRLYGLGAWDFVVDEYYTIYEAPERTRSLYSPAYYVLATASFKMLGVNEWSARLPAMVLGVIALPVFFLTWRTVVSVSSEPLPTIPFSLSIPHWSHVHKFSNSSRFPSGIYWNCSSEPYATRNEAWAT